jgi:signal transduction histidine kinase
MLISKQQLWLTLVAALLLLAAILIFSVFAFSPTAAVAYGPLLLTGFIVALFVGMVCLAWLLRGLLRPYNQLIGEAKRAPVAHSGKSQNEASFVLETFQSVVAQLQEQQEELERLGQLATQRADSAEQFSARIVASMPTGLIAFDAAGTATVVNLPARALFLNGAEATGEHFRVIFSNLPALAEMVGSCLADGRVYRRIELEYVNGMTGAKRIGGTIAPIELSESGARGAVCLLTDITEVTRLREQVALKRNLESLGEMSAGLAHEFKNAMAALHGYAQFLQSIDHDERGKAAADALVQEVRTLSDMITSFLNFARPQPLQFEEIQLGELMQECLRETRSLFDQRDISPTVKEGSHAVEIRADPRLLRQVLLNLLRNAAEAIPDDQKERRVLIKISDETDRDANRWAVVEIQDSGPGIAPSDLLKVFIPFFTTKSTGHGIGLALAHRVITEHGGTLSAANASEGGAVFKARLPAAPPS